MPTLRDVVYENVREGELYEKLDRNRGALFRLRALLPNPGWSTRRLQGSLQPRRDPLHSLGLCRGSAVRPYRKETLLSRIYWGVGLQLWHARLCSALCL